MAWCHAVYVNDGSSVLGGVLNKRTQLLVALMLSLVTMDMAPESRMMVDMCLMRVGMVDAVIYLLESSQYECLVRGAWVPMSMGLGAGSAGMWPGMWCWCSTGGMGGGSWSGGFVWTQMEAVNHATRFAMVQDRAEPCLTPQRKFDVAGPNGVVVVMVRLLRDSAIHSMYPIGGKPRRWSGSSWSSGDRRSKYFSLSSSSWARKAL